MHQNITYMISLIKLWKKLGILPFNMINVEKNATKNRIIA